MQGLEFIRILCVTFFAFISLNIWGQRSVITPVIPSNPQDFGGRVNCIYQDRTGFIWIGKETGLFRYDGYQLRTYRHNKDSKSLGNDNIQCIIEDNSGNLWIGTKGGGLNRYNRESDNFRRYVHAESDPGSIAYNEVFTLLPDSAKNLWIGTDGGGLDYYNSTTGKFTHYNQNNTDLASNKVLAIYKDKSQNIWLGTWDGGLHAMNPKTKTITHLKDNGKLRFGTRTVGELNIFGIVEKSPGILLLATWGQGLIEYNIKSQNFKVLISPKTAANTRSLKITGNKTAWAATSSGLLKMTPGQAPAFIPDNTGDYGNTSALVIDRTGIVWVGYENGSIGKINPANKKFELIPQPNPLGNSAITALEQASEPDKIYAASGNKLFLMNVRSFGFKSYEVPHQDVVSLMVSLNQAIAVSSNGLSSLENSTVSKISLQDSVFKNRQFWSVYKESDTSFLLGALGAAYQFIKTNSSWEKSKTYYTGEKGGISSSHYPACFLKDSRNNLWIGTFGGGLNLLKKGSEKFTYFSNSENSSPSISDNFVECLFEDKKGNIWVGTHNGLDCINPQNLAIKSYTMANGLQNNWIASLEEDAKGNIWAGTHDGLSSIRTDGSIRNYGTDEGLPSNYFSTRTSANPDNGSLWFGTNKGIVWFYPDSIGTDPFSPEVTITGFKINNQSTAPANKVFIGKNSTFSFQFAALHYFNPKKTKYRYILQGYDKTWQLAGTDRQATYSDVPPGKYVFSVVASNNDGIWSSHRTSVEITIPRGFPWWLILVVLTLLLLYFYFKIFRNKKEVVPEEKKIYYREVNPSEVLTDSAEEIFLKKALKVVEENIGDPDFGVEEMCLKICISRPQLYRKIQATTGLSVTEFIKEVRLKRAAQLLKQKHSNISEIAYSVGFNDPKYFSKCFKQKFGVSPARFIDENERFLPPQ